MDNQVTTKSAKNMSLKNLYVFGIVVDFLRLQSNKLYLLSMIEVLICNEVLWFC